MHSTDERECIYILTAVGNFGQLALKVADVGLEAVTLPYFDREKVVVVLLGLPARGILSEECSAISSKLQRECDGRE